MKNTIIAIRNWLLILSAAAGLNANAGAVPCLEQYTTYEPDPSIAKVQHYINNDGSIHLAAYNDVSFTVPLDVYTEYWVTYLDGSTRKLAQQWEYNVYSQHGINIDIPKCGSGLKSVTLKCTVYRHGQLVVPKGSSRITVSIPTLE
jgi:hypothetical protein